MVNSNKSKSNAEIKQEAIRDKITNDWMPFWKKEEDCFKAAIITDPDTKRKTRDSKIWYSCTPCSYARSLHILLYTGPNYDPYTPWDDYD
jgi:hypothetical protein